MQYAVFRLGVDPVRQSNSTQFTFLLWKNFDSFIHTHTNTRTHTSWSIARDISNRPSIFCLWQTKQKKISGIPLVDGESTTTPPTNLSSINNRICGSWKLAEGLATKYMNKVYVAQPIVESIEIYCGGILLGSYIYICDLFVLVVAMARSVRNWLHVLPGEDVNRLRRAKMDRLLLLLLLLLLSNTHERIHVRGRCGHIRAKKHIFAPFVCFIIARSSAHCVATLVQLNVSFMIYIVLFDLCTSRFLAPVLPHRNGHGNIRPASHRLFGLIAAPNRRFLSSFKFGVAVVVGWTFPVFFGVISPRHNCTLGVHHILW